MKKTLLLLAGLIFFGLAEAQNSSGDSSLQLVHIRETVISANRSSQVRSAVAQQVVVIRHHEIEQMNA